MVVAGGLFHTDPTFGHIKLFVAFLPKINGPVVAKRPIMHPFSLAQAAVMPKAGHYGPFGLLQVRVIPNRGQYWAFGVLQVFVMPKPCHLTLFVWSVGLVR